LGALKVLIDTHALLWWLFDDKRLSRRARTTISARENNIVVSAASAWEIATKHRIGKLPEAGDVPLRLPDYLRRAGFDVLPISVEHALAAGALPGPHRDPFDRMLAAQARLEAMMIISADPVFASYGIETRW
jgi:PIN domain nuclease of toxin-antitoxin system